MATALHQPTGTMSAEEREARQQLAACYRVFDHMGWSEMIYNHITLKVPGEEGAFLINPFGLHFSEITASSLVKIDIDGNKLSDSPYGVNRAGFVQHALFHRHLPDAHCIAHTHTTAGMAVSSTKGGLRPINFYACNFAGPDRIPRFRRRDGARRGGRAAARSSRPEADHAAAQPWYLGDGQDRAGSLPEALGAATRLRDPAGDTQHGRAAGGLGRGRRRPPARPPTCRKCPAVPALPTSRRWSGWSTGRTAAGGINRYPKRYPLTAQPSTTSA